MAFAAPYRWHNSFPENTCCKWLASSNARCVRAGTKKECMPEARKEGTNVVQQQTGWGWNARVMHDRSVRLFCSDVVFVYGLGGSLCWFALVPFPEGPLRERSPKGTDETKTGITSRCMTPALLRFLVALPVFLLSSSFYPWFLPLLEYRNLAFSLDLFRSIYLSVWLSLTPPLLSVGGLRLPPRRFIINHARTHACMTAFVVNGRLHSSKWGCFPSRYTTIKWSGQR